MAGIELPARAIREQIVSAIDLLVHVERSQDGRRRVTQVAEITGLEGEVPLLQALYRFEHAGYADGRVQGEHVATGIVPRCVETMRTRGEEIPMSWFQRATGRGRRG
jgi:pilus assembly protein CpaF